MLLTLRQYLLLCSSIGIFLSIYAYFKPHKIIKQQESKLSFSKKMELYIIRFIHYFVILINTLFFMVKINLVYDIYFIIYTLLVVSHWRIYEECCLTIYEKIVLDPSYKPGTSCNYEPFMDLIHNNDINESSSGNLLFYINMLIVFIRLSIPAFYGPFTISSFKEFYKNNY